MSPRYEGDHSDQHCGQDLQPGRLTVDAAGVADDERDDQRGQHHDERWARVVQPELVRQEDPQAPGDEDGDGHRPPALTHVGLLRIHKAR